jgi:hypothetical protein
MAWLRLSDSSRAPHPFRPSDHCSIARRSGSRRSPRGSGRRLCRWATSRTDGAEPRYLRPGTGCAILAAAPTAGSGRPAPIVSQARKPSRASLGEPLITTAFADRLAPSCIPAMNVACRDLRRQEDRCHSIHERVLNLWSNRQTEGLAAPRRVGRSRDRRRRSYLHSSLTDCLRHRLGL